MIKFPGGKVYIKIADASVTTEMINKSTSYKKSNMPLNSITSERLLETSEPVDDVFANYVWMGSIETRIKLKDANWV